MTTSTQDIKAIVELYCESVNDIELDRFLSKLPYEDLDVLQAILEGIQTNSTEDQEVTYKEGYDKGYDKGYNKGYDKGYNKGYDKGYNEGYEEGYSEGYNNGYREGDVY